MFRLTTFRHYVVSCMKSSLGALALALSTRGGGCKSSDSWAQLLCSLHCARRFVMPERRHNVNSWSVYTLRFVKLECFTYVFRCGAAWTRNTYDIMFLYFCIFARTILITVVVQEGIKKNNSCDACECAKAAHDNDTQCEIYHTW